MIDHPSEACAMTAVLGPLRRDDLLFAAERSGRIAPLQVVRTSAVLGELHVRSAAMHAQRAIAQARAQASRPEVEFVRYLAGERQIRRALDKAGLAESEPHAVVVALGPHRTDALRHFVDQLGLREDDSLIAATPERFAAWGFTAAQLAATTPQHRAQLVLEAVALVDVRTNP